MSIRCLRQVSFRDLSTPARRATRPPGLVALLALLALFTLAVPRAHAQLVDYEEIDRVEAPWVDFNTTSVRPMVLDANTLYAINSHDSTLTKFVGATTYGPWPLPWGPVAIAKWAHSGSAVQLVVVCRNSSCLVRLDTSGTILAVIPLIGSSPADGSGADESGGPVGAGDVVVDSTNDFAYVSCSWIDAVLQIDLTTDTVTKRWDETINPAFRMKAPLFLSLVDGGPTLVVAPLLSGNNTTVDRGTSVETFPVVEGPGGNTVVSLDGEDVADQLPDEDLFLIDPTEDEWDPAAVTPVARRVGTTLFAHGKNPSTGDYWMLNTEAINADPAMPSEPTINGKFAKNRLTILTDLFGGPISDGEDSGTNTIRILDKMASAQNVSLGQPYALAFHKLSTSAHYGKAYVAGLLNDKIVRLNSDGTYDAALRLPATSGYIPRGILLNGSETIVLVYCWGTNEVLTYSVTTFANPPTSPAPTPSGVYDVGYDPAPTDVQDGRKLFYDGTRSLDANLSCASCHIEGRTDLVVWNLSNATTVSGTKGPDDKGPMATQTLAGIERLAPFHWRGERRLIDFNGAFTGLLGHSSQLDPKTEFPDFERFVFSIQNPANPFAHRNRQLSSDIDLGLPSGITEDPDADAGQTTFRDELTFFHDAGVGDFNFRCNDCHAAPSGTNNDIHFDFPGKTPRRNNFKPAPFPEPWVKNQSRVVLPMGDDVHQVYRSFLGVGTSHTGLVPDFFGFANLIVADEAVAANIASFILQWDQGVGQGAHFSFFLDDASFASTQLDYLEDQVGARNCDAVVFGTTLISEALVPMRWFWDRNATTQVFRSETNLTRSLQDFRDGAENDGEINVVLGVPVGMSRRFGVDYDMDGILNGSDTADYTPGTPSGDSTAPTFSRGPATVFHSTRVARLGWQTSEPAKINLEYKEGSGSATSVAIDGYSVSDTYLLTDLRPSTETGNGGAYASEAVTYSWRARPTDKAGNVGSWSGWVTFTTKTFMEPEYISHISFAPGVKKNFLEQVVVRELGDLTVSGVDSDTADCSIEAEVGYKRGGPVGSIDAPDRLVVARIFVKRGSEVEFKPIAAHSVTLTALSGTWQADTVTVKNLLLGVGDGPYLLGGPTDGGDGIASFDFRLDGLQSGDKILFNIESIVIFIPLNDGEDPGDYIDSGDFEIDSDLRFPFALWDFPYTKEDNAGREGDF